MPTAFSQTRRQSKKRAPRGPFLYLRVLQRRNALFNRRVRAKELAYAAGDTHGRHALGQFAWRHATQSRQGIDHGLLTPQQLGGTRIGAELALTREPGHHHGGGKAQHDVEHKGADHVANAGAAAALVALAQKNCPRHS